MADREEIIRGLQIERECVSMDCDRDCGKCDLVQDRDWLLSVYDGALELLKKQEAKPVIVTINAYGTRFYHCPRCNRDLYVYPRQLYCSQCGQEVTWDA